MKPLSEESYLLGNLGDLSREPGATSVESDTLIYPASVGISSETGTIVSRFLPQKGTYLTDLQTIPGAYIRTEW